MKSAQLAALAVIWAGAAAAATSTPAPHCRLETLGAFPVVMRGGVPTVEAEIDGRPVRLIVDTGASSTLLFASAAPKTGARLMDAYNQVYGVGGATELYVLHAKTFRLGSLVERNADLLVADQRFGDAQGLLGANFLLQADIEFDLPHGEIRFFKPVGCTGDEVVYWGQAYAVADMNPRLDDQIQVEVRVNGVRTLAEIDSGAAESTLTPGAARLAGLAADVASGHADPAIHGIGPATVSASSVVVPTFAFGQETIHNAVLRVADLFGRDRTLRINDLVPVPVADMPEMLLGADFLAAHRVFVARKQHRIYVSYEGGRIFRPPTPPADTHGAPGK